MRRPRAHPRIAYAVFTAAISACASESDDIGATGPHRGGSSSEDAGADGSSSPSSGGSSPGGSSSGGTRSGGSTSGGSITGGTGSGGTSACDRAVEARRYDATAKCLGPLEAAGCVDAARGCTEMTVPAIAADGSCWSFNDTCLPEGFTPVADDACSQGAYTATCESLPEDLRCEVIRVEAVLQRLEQRCATGIEQFVGCRAGGCSELSVHAWGPDGTCWHFGDGCIPPDFTLTTAGDACRDAVVRGVCGHGYDPEYCRDLPVLEGRRFDPARGCLEAPERVGCVPFETTCDGALVPARRFDTTCWLVPASCVPSSFSVAAAADPCADVAAMPSCDG